MKETFFHYVPHADVPRFTQQGWKPLKGLNGTHHGVYSVLMEWTGEGEPPNVQPTLDVSAEAERGTSRRV